MTWEITVADADDGRSNDYASLERVPNRHRGAVAVLLAAMSEEFGEIVEIEGVGSVTNYHSAGPYVRLIKYLP